MAWIETHDDIWEHSKTIKLSKILKISLVQTVGHLLSLWHFTLRNAWENADLSEWGDDGIESAARWEGKPGIFVNALRDTGCLDGSVVHGWMERAGTLIMDRLRKRQERSKKVQDLSANNPGKTEATVPYRTVPNRTVPTSSGDKPRENGPFQLFMNRILKDFLSIPLDDQKAVSAAYRRFGRAGKDILAFAGGDPEKAYQGVDAIAEYMQAKGLTWTFDTAAKWFPDYLNGGLKDANKANRR